MQKPYILNNLYVLSFNRLNIGPSFCVDTACSSSLLALDHALTAIRTGQCTAAIVAGTSLCVKPTTSLQFNRLSKYYFYYFYALIAVYLIFLWKWRNVLQI